MTSEAVGKISPHDGLPVKGLNINLLLYILRGCDQVTTLTLSTSAALSLLRGQMFQSRFLMGLLISIVLGR